VEELKGLYELAAKEMVAEAMEKSSGGEDGEADPDTEVEK
jgi:hypothetical protein